MGEGYEINGNGRLTNILRWLSGVFAVLVTASAISVVSILRQQDNAITETMEWRRSVSSRLDNIEDDLRTNRMTRMATETRIELDAIHREIADIRQRIKKIQ